ncbi:hypothetical protein [Chakrabartyella piscis]|uniref:hypothetical protein n=1 Tax=Chakrabartyella piscis TaxID=2918914 RepID=UPI0029588B08|nr:hypothetical protein [Chakrabartyella piscis]
MKEEQEKEIFCKGCIEVIREVLLQRAYTLENRFYLEFFVQCIESTTVDAYEMFLEMPMRYNYFYEQRRQMGIAETLRFFQLTALHHTIRTVKRRKKELEFAEIYPILCEVFCFTKREEDMTLLLQDCVTESQSEFQTLFTKFTPKFLWNQEDLTPFSFAFIGNFWYNSYSDFMGSFIGNIPFHIRRKRA